MTKKTKQIGYLTAMFISVGSTIGAGIFFKNSSIFANAHGQLGFMIASWIVAALGVLAIAFSLIELASASKANGITDFTNKFTKKGFAKFVSSYMILVYLPINYFAMSAYAAMSLQDAIAAGGGPNLSGWAIAGIAFAFYAWFLITGFFQKRIAIGSQLMFTIIKFIPLVVVVVFAVVQVVGDGSIKTTLIDPQKGLPVKADGLTSFSPWLGLMASIPAILFAFDGFYCVTALKSDLKEPRKMGLVIVLAISVITSAYLIFGIVTGLANAGSFSDVKDISTVLKVIFNVFIMFAVFGIINGFGIATPELYYLAYKEHPIGFTAVVRKAFKLNKESDEKLATWIVSAGISFIFFIILAPIGICAMGQGSYDGYSPSAAGLFTLTDYITNYTSLAVFVFIGSAIFGGLINRKTKKVKVEKSKYFVYVGIVALIFLAIGTIYMVVANMVGMAGVGGADKQTETIKFVILIATLIIAIVPNSIDFYKKKILTKNNQIIS